MSQRLTEKTFQAGAIGINYAEGPDKGPSIVLLHGGSANWHDFEDLGNVFSGHWHVYIPDLRGHGKSGRVPWGYSVQEYAAAILPWILSLGRRLWIGQTIVKRSDGCERCLAESIRWIK